MSEIKKQGGFLDPFFGAFRREKKAAPTQTIGVSGTAVFGGFLQSNEADFRLQGRERYRTYSLMLANTTIVGASVRLFLNLLAKAKWKAEPADDSSEALELAEKVEDALFNMTTPFKRVVRRAGMGRLYGYSLQEWTAERLEDGTIGFLDVEPRPQITIERWDLDESGTVLGVVQRSPQTQEEIYIPRERLVYVVDDSLNDSPEGLGLFRHISEAVEHLRKYEKLEGFGFETDLRGIPIGRGPFEELQKMVERGDLTAQQKLDYESGLRTFVSKHIKTEDLGLLLDSKSYETTDDKKSPSAVRMWDLELLQGSATSFADVAKAIERLNREIARVFGTEGLLLGSTSTGSLALSDNKTELLALVVATMLEELSEVFEADLIVPLFEMNGWDMDLMPAFKPEAIQHRDIQQITGALRDLAQAGSAVGPQDEAFMEVFDLLGLTRPNLSDIDLDAALGGAEGSSHEDVTPPKEPEEDAKEG